MSQFDRGARGVIRLHDLSDAADEACGEDRALQQFDRVAARLSRRSAAAQNAPIRLRIVAFDSPRETHRRLSFHRPALRSAAQPRGWQTAQREADLQRLVEELSTEVQRLDEDLEVLLNAAAG